MNDNETFILVMAMLSIIVIISFIIIKAGEKGLIKPIKISESERSICYVPPKPQTRVKIFADSSTNDLEAKVNKWLETDPLIVKMEYKDNLTVLIAYLIEISEDSRPTMKDATSTPAYGGAK